MTISSADGTTKFKSVTFNMKINASSKKYPLISATSGSFSPEVTDNSPTTTTWTAPEGGVTTITFTFPPKSDVGGNWTFSGVSVTYETSTPSSAVAFATAAPSIDLKDGNTYTQTATTATGYTGNVTYSITASTAGATINETTGEVTAIQAGSVTVQASASAVSGSWIASTASYTLTVTDTRVATTTTIVSTGITNTDVSKGTAAGSLSANVTVTSSGDAVAGAEVTWTSSNPAIATIDEDGNLTLVAKGSTTITASYAGTDTYMISSDTYELTVTNSSVITINLNNTLFGISTGNNATEQSKTVDNVTITTGCSSSASTKTYYDGSHIRFYADSYMTLTAPNGYIITSISLNRYNSDTWNPTKVTASTGSLSGSAPLIWSGEAKDVTFTYSGQCRTASVDAACTDGAKYYGTYSNGNAFVVPEGLTVSEISVIDNELLVEDYATGDVVPANTGVLMSATTAGDKTITLSAEAGTSVLGEDNMLKPSGDAGITAANMTVAYTKFYRLTMHNGTTIGFWWGAADGAAFGLAANKAYLAVPTGATAPSFFWFGGETTGIDMVHGAGLKVNGSVFNLNGQRVAQPTKGLYIVNGKKIIIK